MKLPDARRMALARLADAGLPDAALDAARLLAHVLGISRGDLALLPATTLISSAQLTALDDALRARLAHQPVSQIIGRRLFWGRNFHVTGAVLDPRPETETLIAAALELHFASVLDLGLGTGCILFTLLAERAGAYGEGVELSPQALDVARINREALGLDGAVLHQGSWFEPVSGRFDLITSNPPYIAEDEMAALSPEVREWEPALALTPGGDGLAAYRAIASGAPAHLNPGGWLLVEIGPTQAAAVAGLFGANGLQDIAILPDFDGRDRVVKAQRGR